jgi:hypothetical protein
VVLPGIVVVMYAHLRPAAICLFTAVANRAPFTEDVYYPQYPPWRLQLRRNHSVLIDLGISTANETTHPVSDADYDVLTATVNTATLQYGQMVKVGNGLYNYTASPGVNLEQLTDTASYTVTDGR